MEKILLITCFEPFNGRMKNISMEVVDSLPDRIGNFAIEKMKLPVVFGAAGELAIGAAEELGAHAVLCIGEAGSRGAITPEMVASNMQDARIPDNNGKQPIGEEVVEGGENAHFSRHPVREMVKAMSALGLPAEVSYSAGTYVCNDLFYRMLDHFRKTDVECGFIHVPREGELTTQELCAGIVAAIQILDESSV